MAKENKHQYEYKHHTIVKNSRIKSKKLTDAVDNADLENKHAVKLKKYKEVKAIKFRDGTAHIGRAKEKRKIVKAMGVNFIDDPKLR